MRSLAQSDDEMVLAVRDEGPGIPPAEQSRIFERFYRSPAVQVRSGSGVGLGLGLYITREIVERHDGRLWLESVPDQGSTFYVALPLARATAGATIEDSTARYQLAVLSCLQRVCALMPEGRVLWRDWQPVRMGVDRIDGADRGERLTFPAGFRWGVATSSHQCEGGNTANNWYAWEQAGHIKTGERAGLACDWWRNAERDFDLARDLGLNALRLSVEWSRIEPRPGKWDGAALTRYRQMLVGLHERGIEPMVTLHHFTNPLWFEERGGFLAADAMERFDRFTERVVTALGDLCDLWCTVNEPNVYAVQGYLFGAFPPGRKGDALAVLRVQAALARAHAAAYRTIHRHPASRARRLGAERQHLRPCPPWQSLRPPGRRTARRHVQRLLSARRRQWPRRLPTQPRRGRSARRPRHLRLHRRQCLLPRSGRVRSARPNRALRPPLRRSGRCAGAISPSAPRGARCTRTGCAVSRCASPRLASRSMSPRTAWPTPPTACDPGSSPWPCAPCMPPSPPGARRGGHYHWTLVDNFEWSEGWKTRFGLVALDLRRKRARRATAPRSTASSPAPMP